MSTYARAFRGFDRDVRLYFGVVALLGTGVFGGISVVLLNLYLLRLGYGPETVGVVNAASQIGLAAFALPSAVLGRRFGSRPMLLLGLALLALGNGGLPLAEALAEPFRFGWLLLTPAVASIGLALLLVNEKPFVMGVTTAAERNHVYSMQGALWPLAGAVGGLLGGALPMLFALALGLGLDGPAPYRYPLLISAGLVAIAFVVMTRTRGPAADAARAGVVAAGRPPVGLVWAMALVVFAQVAGEVAARTFLNVYLDRGLGVTTETIGPIFATAQAVGVGAALSMPLFARRIGILLTFVFSTAAMVAAMLPLALVPDVRAAGLGYVGVIAAASIARPCIIVYQLELVRQEWRGLMAAGTTLAYGASAGLVALGGGYLIAGVGYSALFLACGLVSLAGAGLFWAYFRTPRGELARPNAVATGAGASEDA